MDMVPEASRPFGDCSKARQLHPADFAIGIGCIALSVDSSFASKALLVANELGAYGADIGPAGSEYKAGDGEDWNVNVIDAPTFVQQFIIRTNECPAIWKAKTVLVIGMGAIILLCIHLFGMDACRVYAKELLPFALRGQIVDPYNIAWGSLSALLARLLIYEPELNPSPAIHMPWLYALLYSLILAFILAAFIWAIGWNSTKDQDRVKMEWAS